MSEKKKSWITRYGSPETRTPVEHEDDECLACEAAGHLRSGEILFVEVESAEGSVEIRRVRAVFRVFGRSMLSCRVVTKAEADAEIARIGSGAEIEGKEEEARKNPLVRILGDVLHAFASPEHYAAEMGARYGKKISQHDPCASCGHGRFLHKKQAYVIEEQRLRDEALSPTQCRHGHHQGGVQCPCPSWSGVETPFDTSFLTPGLGFVGRAEKPVSLHELLKTKKTRDGGG